MPCLCGDSVHCRQWFIAVTLQQFSDSILLLFLYESVPCGCFVSWLSLVSLASVMTVYLQVLANLVMEELLPSLQTELLPKLKGKKPERKRVWFAVSEISLCSSHLFLELWHSMCWMSQSGNILTGPFWITGLICIYEINPLFFCPPHHPKQ